MNDLTRVSVLLLGLFWLVRGLSSFSSSASRFLTYPGVFENSDWVSSWLVAGSISLGMTLLFAVAPSALLMISSRQIADRLAPRSHSAPTASPSAVYVLGCTLLAYFFMISGAVSLVAGGISTVTYALMEQTDLIKSSGLASGLGVLGSGGVECVAAFVLYGHASRQNLAA